MTAILLLIYFICFMYFYTKLAIDLRPDGIKEALCIAGVAALWLPITAYFLVAVGVLKALDKYDAWKKVEAKDER